MLVFGVLYGHILFFGFESMYEHIISSIHFKRKVAEQPSYSIDVCHILGSLADYLFEFGNQRNLEFIAPLSKHCFIRKDMA